RASDEPVDLAVAVVGEEVRTLQCGDGAAAVDGTAGDGAPRATVVVLIDRCDRAGGRGGLAIGVRAFHITPSEVLPARHRRAEEVHLLDGALPDVTDPEIVGRAVEGEPPGVAQAVLPDFGRPP